MQQQTGDRTCLDCGFENPEQVEFCEACGADLLGSHATASQSQFDAHLMTDLVDALSPRQPVTVPREGTSAAAAIDLMREHNIGAVLVTHDGRLAGIFTENDVLHKLSSPDRVPRDVGIAEVMTSDPVVLRHDDTVAVALHKMVMGRFRHIPLVDAEGRVDGIFSGRDILKHLLKLLPSA